MKGLRIAFIFLQKTLLKQKEFAKLNYDQLLVLGPEYQASSLISWKEKKENKDVCI